MEKTIIRISWVLILSVSPILSIDSVNNDKGPIPGQKVICRSEVWENGQKISEKTEYAPAGSKQPPRQGGMGAWVCDDLYTIPEDPPPYYDQHSYW